MGILDNETLARLRRKAALALLQGEQELRRTIEKTAPETLAKGRNQLRDRSPYKIFWSPRADGNGWDKAYTGMHRDWAAAFRAAGRRSGGLHNVDIEQITLSGDVSRIRLTDSRLTGVTFLEADLGGSRLFNLTLDQGGMRRTRLAGARIDTVTSIGPLFMDRCNFANARLKKITAPVIAKRICFAGAHLSDSDLSNSRLINVDFSRASLNNVDLSGATISSDCVFDGARLHGIKGLETVRVIGPDGRGRPDLRLTVNGIEKVAPQPLATEQKRPPLPPYYI
ncbi:MAG: hypothetical protein Alpg2KO_02740 [Alphaproteobacteria bacterium]